MDNAFDPYSQWLGIPPGPRPVDHYRLLGVERFESDAGLLHTRTMQRMAEVRKYQMGPQSEHALRLQQEISRAFDVLSDPRRKAAYDLQLRTPRPIPAASPSADAQQVESGSAVAPPPVVAPPPRQPRLVPRAPAPARQTADEADEPAEPPLLVMRLLPWFVGGIALFAAVALAVQFLGGQGTLRVQFTGPMAGVAALLDGAPVNLEQLKQGHGLNMGMHKLQLEGPDIEPYAKEFAVPRGETVQLQVALVGLSRPATQPPLPSVPQAAPPSALPTIASSFSLEGSVWLGDDAYPSTTFTFERGGVLSWSHDRGAYRTGTWEQSADTLYFEQNKEFREFEGRIEGDRIDGDSWNVHGKRWNLSLRLVTRGAGAAPLAAAPAEAARFRMWLNRTTKKSIRASFESLIAGDVRLKLANSQLVVTTIPLDDLARKDRAYVRGAVGKEYFDRHKDPPTAGGPAQSTARLEGTAWAGIDNNQQKTFHFAPGGVLSYTSEGQQYRNGTWQQVGNTVYFETNNKFREFRGLINGDLLEGASWNVQGLKWRTSIRKQ